MGGFDISGKIRTPERFVGIEPCRIDHISGFDTVVVSANALVVFSHIGRIDEYPDPFSVGIFLNRIHHMQEIDRGRAR